TAVARQAEVKQILGEKYAGDTIAVTVKRGDEEIKAELVLAAELVAFESGFLGILPVREGTGEDAPAGVGVRFVYPDSPAAKVGLQKRDRIIRFAGEETPDAAKLTELVSRVRPGETAELVFTRDGQEQTVEVELASLPATVPADLPTSSIPPPPAEDAGEDGPQTGRFTVEMPAFERSYWAYVPDNYNPNHRYGLLVWLHPGGDTMQAAMIRHWRGLCDQRGIMIVAPLAGDPRGWIPNETEFIKGAVEEMTANYSVDPARVFLHGFSTGGNFALQTAFKERELFRGVAAVAAPLQTRPPENDPDYRLQLYLACGSEDNLLRQVRATAEALERLKYPVTFTEIKELDHRYPPDATIEEIARWADALDRI
ncbi:MAG: PDZ domain-containing protein, partial [Planctomycetaceae bacterium]